MRELRFVSKGGEVGLAADFADKNFRGYYWVFGKGRADAGHDVYGIQVYALDSDEGDAPLVECENANPMVCVVEAAVELGLFAPIRVN